MVEKRVKVPRFVVFMLFHALCHIQYFTVIYDQKVSISKPTTNSLRICANKNKQENSIKSAFSIKNTYAAFKDLNLKIIGDPSVTLIFQINETHNCIESYPKWTKSTVKVFSGRMSFLNWTLGPGIVRYASTTPWFRITAVLSSLMSIFWTNCRSQFVSSICSVGRSADFQA